MSSRWKLTRHHHASRIVAKALRLALACLLALTGSLPGLPALAQSTEPPLPAACQDPFWLGTQQVLICIPDTWNGDLVLYAHGYVPPQEELALPMGELTIDGQFVPATILEAGFAFATTSYGKNGYALEQAEADLAALVDHFKSPVPDNPLRRVFVVGASEGGIITAMLVEKHPEIYNGGGLALCGPVGGMPYQVKYLGDFRVVFDYFFDASGGPYDVFPFGVANVPEGAYSLWNSTYVPAITAALSANPGKTDQLFNVTRAARDPADLAGSAVSTSLQVLFYSIWGTLDLNDTAGGNPFGNRLTFYRGSNNDRALNRGVERVAAVPAARSYVRQFYQTTGRLQVPLVTLHTTLDPAVPFRHELIYAGLVTLQGRGQYLTVLPVPRYGHCNFKVGEVLGAFAILLLRSTGHVGPEMQGYLSSVPQAMPNTMTAADADW